MNKVHTDNAPGAIGPYSQAIVHDGIVYASGQVGISPDGTRAQGIEAETRQTLDNLSAVLEAAGASLQSTVKVNVYLQDMGDFQAVNGVYAEYFGSHRPARACVEVAGLPKGVLVEIDCTALVS